MIKTAKQFILIGHILKLNACEQAEKDVCDMTNKNITLFILSYISVMPQVQI